MTALLQRCASWSRARRNLGALGETATSIANLQLDFLPHLSTQQINDALSRLYLRKEATLKGDGWARPKMVVETAQ